MSYQSLLAHMSEILGAVHKTLDVLTHVASTTAQIAPMFGPEGGQGRRHCGDGRDGGWGFGVGDS